MKTLAKVLFENPISLMGNLLKGYLTDKRKTSLVTRFFGRTGTRTPGLHYVMSGLIFYSLFYVLPIEHVSILYDFVAILPLIGPSNKYLTNSFDTHIPGIDCDCSTYAKLKDPACIMFASL